MAKERTAPDSDHYQVSNGIEPIDLIRGMGIFEEYCAGQVIKYIFRYNRKGSPVSDLKKASQYLEWLIAEVEEQKREE